MAATDTEANSIVQELTEYRESVRASIFRELVEDLRRDYAELDALVRKKIEEINMSPPTDEQYVRIMSMLSEEKIKDIDP